MPTHPRWRSFSTDFWAKGKPSLLVSCDAAVHSAAPVQLWAVPPRRAVQFTLACRPAQVAVRRQQVLEFGLVIQSDQVAARDVWFVMKLLMSK